MDQEKLKKLVVAFWIIALFIFSGYVVRLYAKSIDFPVYGEFENQDTLIEEFVEVEDFSEFE